MKSLERIFITRGYAILQNRKYLMDIKADNVMTWTNDPRHAAIFTSKGIAKTIANRLVSKEKTLIVIIEVCVTEADEDDE